MKLVRIAAVCSSILLVAGIVVAQGLSRSLPHRERGMSGEIITAEMEADEEPPAEVNRGRIGAHTE